MGTEAQKLISLSLEKMATCRRRRREMSLHKNLLLTTVIHKARIAIMEETYYMMNTYETDVGHLTNNGIRSVVTNPYDSTSIYYANEQQHQQNHHQILASYEEDIPMDWEGSDGSAPVLSPQSVVIVSTAIKEDEVLLDDKENVSPIDDHEDNDGIYEATCCEQRFGACRSPDCQFLRGATIGGHKRLMMDILMDGDDDDDDDMAGDDQKKLKWDSMIDPDSDTSHAMRLVSVLSASLSGNSSNSNSSSTMTTTTMTTTSTSTSTSTSQTTTATTRLVRSISSPDLCSKQAKDAMDNRTGSSVDRTVMAIAV